MADIFVDPSAATSPMVKVDGVCYRVVGSSNESPVVGPEDIEAEYEDCIGCCGLNCGVGDAEIWGCYSERLSSILAGTWSGSFVGYVFSQNGDWFRVIGEDLKVESLEGPSLGDPTEYELNNGSSLELASYATESDAESDQNRLTEFDESLHLLWWTDGSSVFIKVSSDIASAGEHVFYEREEAEIFDQTMLCDGEEHSFGANEVSGGPSVTIAIVAVGCVCDICDNCCEDQTPFVESSNDFWGIYHNVVPGVLVMSFQSENFDTLVGRITGVPGSYLRIESVVIYEQPFCVLIDKNGEPSDPEMWGYTEIGEYTYSIYATYADAQNQTSPTSGPTTESIYAYIITDGTDFDFWIDSNGFGPWMNSNPFNDPSIISPSGREFVFATDSIAFDAEEFCQGNELKFDSSVGVKATYALLDPADPNYELFVETFNLEADVVLAPCGNDCSNPCNAPEGEDFPGYDTPPAIIGYSDGDFTACDQCAGLNGYNPCVGPQWDGMIPHASGNDYQIDDVTQSGYLFQAISVSDGDGIWYLQVDNGSIVWLGERGSKEGIYIRTDGISQIASVEIVENSAGDLEIVGFTETMFTEDFDDGTVWDGTFPHRDGSEGYRWEAKWQDADSINHRMFSGATFDRVGSYSSQPCYWQVLVECENPWASPDPFVIVEYRKLTGLTRDGVYQRVGGCDIFAPATITIGDAE